jgi:hypothetical protein
LVGVEDCFQRGTRETAGAEMAPVCFGLEVASSFWIKIEQNKNVSRSAWAEEEAWKKNEGARVPVFVGIVDWRWRRLQIFIEEFRRLGEDFRERKKRSWKRGSGAICSRPWLAERARVWGSGRSDGGGCRRAREGLWEEEGHRWAREVRERGDLTKEARVSAGEKG